MKFPYLKFPSKDPHRKWISRPLIPIKLLSLMSYWDGYALVDSGADRSLFNIEIADILGLNLVNCSVEDFRGIEGGSMPAKLHKVKLCLMGMKEEIEIMVGFVDSPSVSAILGQEGFFDAFRIKFERDHGIIDITLVKTF